MLVIVRKGKKPANSEKQNWKTPAQHPLKLNSGPKSGSAGQDCIAIVLKRDKDGSINLLVLAALVSKAGTGSKVP